MKTKFKRKSRYYVYILQCNDGTYYTGYTPDIKRRVELHNNGRAAKYTRDKRPVKLVWCKEYKYFRLAIKKELAIKELTHTEKGKLVEIYAKAKQG